MPAPTETLIRPTTSSVSAATEPVNNALHSLTLIAKADHLSGLGDWVMQTRAALSPAQWETHYLVMIGLHYALFPSRSWPSFPAYLDHLEAIDPVELRNRLIDAYLHMESSGLKPAPFTTREQVLRSADDYISFLSTRFGPDLVDEKMERQAYSYAINPIAMQGLITSHLRTMWETYLAEEWARVESMLHDSAVAFNSAGMEAMGRTAAFEFVTGQSVEALAWEPDFDKHERLIFVPSAHVGPYLGFFEHDRAFGIIFGARLPAGAQVNAPDLSRNEIVVRMSALADDTRLRILRYVADHGEARSQEIIDALSLSQSAASRHLKQLSATGFLSERRCEGAKCYSLSESRLRDTTNALLAFLAVTP